MTAPSAPPPLSPRLLAARRRWRLIALAVGFVTIVVLVEGIVGDRGLLQLLRTRRQVRAVEAGVARARQENARLQREARRLREDPTRIEEVARAELGLIRPGEIMVIVKDRKRSP